MIQESETNLTFSEDDVPDKTFNDDETVMITINMSFKQKVQIKELKKRIVQLSKDEDLFESIIEDEDDKLNNNTMFYIMFQNWIEFMLQDCDVEFIKSVTDSLIFTEYTEILNDLSKRKFDMNEDTSLSAFEVKRVPSNLSMSLCSCCKSPEETNNEDDYSRDTAILANNKKFEK